MRIGDGPSPLTVLLVDDDEDVLSVVGRFIAREGYRVLTAGSPREALRQASAEGGVALLVSDVMMHELTGPELYRRLARQIPGLRVVYISGYPWDELPDGAGSACGAFFLAKPFSADELAAKLREALAGPPR